MHTIFYGIDFKDLNDESLANGYSPDEKALVLSVTITDGIVYKAVQDGRLLKRDGISMPDSGYKFILDGNYILRKDGSLFERVRDLDDAEKSLFYEIGSIGFLTHAEQDGEYNRTSKESNKIRIEEILENKYQKVKPANALDSLYTEPFNVENDVLLIRDGSDSSDKTHGSQGITANKDIESMVIEPTASKASKFPVYLS